MNALGQKTLNVNRSFDSAPLVASYSSQTSSSEPHKKRRIPHFALLFIVLIVVIALINIIFLIGESSLVDGSTKNIPNMILSSLSEESYQSPSSSLLKKRSGVIPSLSRYEPPAIPEPFSRFIIPPSSRLNTTLVPTVMERDRSYRHDSNTSEAIFTTRTNCLAFDDDIRIRKQYETTYSSCHFENICYSNRGEWIVFRNDLSEKEKWEEKPIVYASSVYKRDFEPAKIKVTLRNAPDAFHSGSELPKTETSIKLSKNFKWVAKPTFSLFRHSIANVGHTILDNYLPMFNLMVNLEYVHVDNHFLFLDDVYNEWTGEQSKSRMDSELAERTAMEWAGFLSRNRPLQLCYGKGEGMSVGLAPCRQEGLKRDTKVGEEVPEELETCFSSLSIGSPTSYFFNSESREAIFPLFRNYVLDNLGLSISRDYFRKKKRVLVIAVHNKPLHTKNRDSIINVEELVEYLTEKGNELLSFYNSKRLPSEHFTSIRVLNLKLEELSFKQQLQLFGMMDVFVSTQGSASYYSLFMLNPEATMIYVPMCVRETLTCSDYNLRIHKNFSNVRILSLVHHLDMIECVHNGKSYPIGGVSKVNRYYGDCHEKVDPKKLFQLMVSQ